MAISLTRVKGKRMSSADPNADKVLGYLRSISPSRATSDEIRVNTGVKPNSEVHQTTQRLMKTGQIEGRKAGLEWFFWIEVQTKQELPEPTAKRKAPKRTAERKAPKRTAERKAPKRTAERKAPKPAAERQAPKPAAERQAPKPAAEQELPAPMDASGPPAAPEPERERLGPSQFEKVARRVMSEHFDAKLGPGTIPGVRREFGLVSTDRRIVGDAKYFTPVRDDLLPLAEFSRIAEHVWFLEKSDARYRFLVFGNDEEAPHRWLDRYGNLAGDIEFYYLSNDGRLKRLASG